MGESGFFESDDVSKSCPVSSRTINHYGGTICRPSFCRVNPDTMRVDRRIRFQYAMCGREILESTKKKWQIQNYPDTCERGLKNHFEEDENDVGKRKDVTIKCLANYIYLFYFCQ